MATVQLRNIEKRFSEDAVAVKDLDLDIADGEFLVLLGPSGCGKTTTLRMIAGLETQTQGDISIGDKLVNDLPAGDRDIAFVFQFYALYPHLSVRDNVTFPLRAQNISKADVDKRLSDVAKSLQIEHLLNKKPNRLPGGEQQRVALARAMIRQPQVFLMDEPLTNLDAELRADMRAELKHLQHQLATTMVYVTHDQIEAMSMSHRIAVMNLGLLQQVDTPLNIYNKPTTLFVATFIGSPPMNIINCHFDKDDIVADTTQLRVATKTLRAELTPQSKELYFGIRAEDLSLTEPSTTDLKGEVILREPLGDETLYLVDIGGQNLSVKAPPKLKLAIGENVGLNLNPKRVHLFDKQSERTLFLDEARA